MNFYISAEELAQRKHINFSVDLDESGLLISSCPQEIVTPTLVQQPAAGLLTDLNHLTWGELDAIGRSKKARQQIAVGAVKTDHMKNGFAAEYRIIGFDHDDLADGSGKAPFSWEAVRIYKERRPWNSECTNEGGWDKSELRQWLNSEFLALCSDELQAVIRPVVKLTSAGGRSKEIVKSVDRIFILSEKEVYGRVAYSVPGEGSWYEYYRLEDVPYFALDEDGDPCSSGLRSPYYFNTNYFCIVNTSGSIYTHTASWSAGVRPGFSF